MMKIEKATEKDIAVLERLISSEFAYTKFTHQTLLQRIQNPYIVIFKKTNNGKIVGFIEIQLSGNNHGLINAISVDRSQRRKGHGMELLLHALDFMKQQNVVFARLLVKKDNEIAKKIYKNAGFEFKANHAKKIDNSIVEIWQKTLVDTVEQYLN